MGVEYLDSFFTGKDNTLDKTKGLTYAVVMKLVEGLENKGQLGFGIASFPGLHAQLLLLAVREAGEGLEGFIT